MDEPEEFKKLPFNERVARFLGLTVAAGVILYSSVILSVIVWRYINFPYWDESSRDHFAVIVGLPIAGSLGFLLVIYLRQKDGPVEFEAFGFKFKGASGQIIMWILVFGAIAAGQKLLW